MVGSRRISYSFKLLWISSLLASMNESDQKRSRKCDDAIFPTATLSVAMETGGRIWPNFELIQALMHVLITCKYEKDPIKNSGEILMTTFSPL